MSSSTLRNVHDVETIFARRLRELRAARKWSQARVAEVLAERTGLEFDPSAITRIERGQRGIALGEAYAIADALGSRVEDMCDASPARTISDLRRQIAQAHAELVAAEETHQVALAVRDQRHHRLAELQKQLSGVLAAGECEAVATGEEPYPWAPDAQARAAQRESADGTR